jgi:hypothetical protein
VIDPEMKKAEKTKPSPKRRNLPASYVTPEAFVELKQALADALAFELGERRGLKVTLIQIPTQQNTTPDCKSPNARSVKSNPARWK